MASEAELRRAVRYSLQKERSEQTLVNEFWVPRFNVRADVVALDPVMQGYEIKTGRDTLKRLPRQALAYSSVFDLCHVMIAERHMTRAAALVPTWWGIHLIKDGQSTQIREGTLNESVDPEILVRLLWRDEVFEALVAMGESPDPSAGRAGLWRELRTKLNVGELKAIVRQALLTRDPRDARLGTRRFAVL